MKDFMVSRRTNVISLADSIYLTIMEGNMPVITTVGPDSIGQMTKALARARSKLLFKNKSLTWYSYFEDGTGRTDGKPITLIKTTMLLAEAVTDAPG